MKLHLIEARNTACGRSLREDLQQPEPFQHEFRAVSDDEVGITNADIRWFFCA